MQIFKINEDLEFTAESFSNRNSWGHEITAIYKGEDIQSQRTYYQNRTWERYQFQSALKRMIDKLDENHANKVPLKLRILAYNQF